MADWHVGQEIICVDTNWVNPIDHRLTYPIKGRIYTIENILADDYDPYDYGISFHLAEIKTSNAWYAFHFRPVKKKQTDISVFKEILAPTDKKKVLEDA